MKKLIACVLIVLMLASLAGCQEASDSAKVTELQTQVAVLNSKISALTKEIASLRSTTLRTWELSAQPLTDGSGAAVAFQAETDGISTGQKVVFEVVQDGEVKVSLPCGVHDGLFFANAELDAKDGYSFFCVLSSGDEYNRVALVDPENEDLANLMHLGQVMNAYCTLVVDGYDVTDKAISANLNAQVTLPSFTDPDAPTAVETAQILFTMGDETLSTLDVTLEEGEDGTLEASMPDTKLTIPEEMEDDAQLNLKLIVRLSDGRKLVSMSGSWYLHEGELTMVSG